MKPILLASILFSFLFCHSQTHIEIAGYPVTDAPHFMRVAAFNANQTIHAAVDLGIYPQLDGVNATVFIASDKNASQWISDPSLVDVSANGSTAFLFSGNNVQANNFLIADAFELESIPALGIGVGYDVVIDVDNNGILSAADFIDGYDDEGFYVVSDLTQLGQLQVTTQDFSETEELTKRIWYPSNINDFSKLPLVVISHGWTHEYTYYDYIGEHIASYGYIVMAHWNDVGNGDPAATNSASLSLIANIDHLLGNQSTLFGGILNGKIDSDHIALTGHSTGGETPVRAFTRLHNGENSSVYFVWQDIVLISSICPVAWLSNDFTNPYDVNYHQFLGGADTDASGSAGDGYYQPLSIFERATGNRQLTYIHGAGHEVFHGFDSSEQWPDSLASGPDLVSKVQVHPVVKSYFLALLELYVKQNAAAKDFFTRNYVEFHPMGIDPVMKISNEYRDGHFADKWVIDDFQTNPELNLASSGAAVEWSVELPSENLMQDFDWSFAFDGSQPSNGMTRARFDDDPNCAVFEWSEPGDVVYSIPSAMSDFSAYDVLSFRACQRTRHPYNEAWNDAINFSVKLVDDNNNEMEISTKNYGPVIRTYPRDEAGEIFLCLTDGEYTVDCGGDEYPSEVSWEIPGYLEGVTGSYTFTIADADSCTNIQVLMYDSWGDGWNGAILTITDSEGNLIASGELTGGTGPVPGAGWQNEFNTVRMRLTDFLTNGSGVDLQDISQLVFSFGGEVPQGALGIDDIELVNSEVNIPIGVAERMKENEILLFPNPADNFIHLRLPFTTQSTHIQILSVDGKIHVQKSFRQDEQIAIVTGSLAEGIYILRCETTDGICSKRFAITR